MRQRNESEMSLMKMKPKEIKFRINIRVYNLKNLDNLKKGKKKRNGCHVKFKFYDKF